MSDGEWLDEFFYLCKKNTHGSTGEVSNRRGLIPRKNGAYLDKPKE